ncbi:MAG: hypothetical protein AB7L91_15330 [Dehalococcoidia bacterium]
MTTTRTSQEETQVLPALPALIDQRRLREELGVAEATAERIFRSVTLVRFPELRKVYAYRADVIAFMRSCETQPEAAR